MKKMHLLFGAMVAVAAVTAPAQAQTVSANPGTPSTVTSIDESILSNQMGGMKVTGVFDDNGPTSGFDFWRDLSGVSSTGSSTFASGTWGADIRSSQGTRIATVYMTGSNNTYSSNWSILLHSTTNLRSLTFEGGSYGNVLFDRSNDFVDNCGGNEGTCGSDIGRDFNLSNSWNGVTAQYSNAVSLNGAPVRNDLYTSVFVDFQNATYTTCVVFIFCSDNPDVPDNNGSNPNPFSFQMDTDKGTFARVPEPSSVLLMASGLIGMVGFARRRNRNA